MIIKLTVKDNDYSDVLEIFAKTLFEKLMMPKDELDDNEWRHEFKKKKNIHILLNPNYTLKLDKEQEKVIVDEVTAIWERYIKKRYIDEMDWAYLKNSFKASAGFSFKEKFENGEAVYLFTNGNLILTQ